MTTRVIHQVRCRNPKDSQMWIDMAVIDALALRGTNGQEFVIYTKASECTPYIVDKTPEKNGKTPGFAQTTRVSHMERVHGKDDPTQKFDIEVLDAFCVSTPILTPGMRSETAMSTPDVDGYLDSGQQGSPIALLSPTADSEAFVVDKTGLKLDNTTETATRAGHINLVTEKGNTDDKTDGLKTAGDSVPPKQLSWCATLMLDGMNFDVPNSNQICLIFPSAADDELDSTKMVKDPDTGEDCPPDNKDPNVYIGFPDSDDPAGPTEGTNVGIPINETSGKQEPINMGALWYIKKVSPSFRPWFWYCDVQTPKAFSFFGNPGSLGSWAWRGFVLWNNYPVIWILSVNNSIVPMGVFGSPSLDLCGRTTVVNPDGSGTTDFQNVFPVPSGQMLAAPRPVGSVIGFPFSALGLSGIPDDPFGVPETNSTPFGPFGLLTMTYAPLGPPPGGISGAGIFGGTGTDLWDGRPNCWQLTGLQQPKLQNPNKPFDPAKNTYLSPSAKDAKQCAELFRDNWNSCSNAVNATLDGMTGSVGDAGRTWGHISSGTPPGWKWAIPWYNAIYGPNNAGLPVEGYTAAFQNSIAPGIGAPGIPLEIYAPATCFTLQVDRFDPALWDCTHMEFNRNPNNYFLAAFNDVAPPFLWKNDPWLPPTPP